MVTGQVEQERFAGERKTLEEEIKKLQNLLEDQHSHVSVLKDELSKQYANNIRMKANMTKDSSTRSELHISDGLPRGDKLPSHFQPAEDTHSPSPDASPPSSSDSLTDVDKHRMGRGAIAPRPARKNVDHREVCQSC